VSRVWNTVIKVIKEIVDIQKVALISIILVFLKIVDRNLQSKVNQMSMFT
jgi:hypothetical protein